MDFGVLLVALQDPAILAGGGGLSLLGTTIVLLRRDVADLREWRREHERERDELRRTIAVLGQLPAQLDQQDEKLDRILDRVGTLGERVGVVEERTRR